MNLVKITALIMAGLFVSACAQQQTEPAPIVVEPEPVFDKYGNQVN